MSAVAIETRQVTLDVIRVGDKQMTLAVLRQLPNVWPFVRIDPEDEKIDPQITFWGYVAIDEKIRPHGRRLIYIVFEKDSRLCKCEAISSVSNLIGAKKLKQLYIAT